MMALLWLGWMNISDLVSPVLWCFDGNACHLLHYCVPTSTIFRVLWCVVSNFNCPFELEFSSCLLF
jgi:hypothetical protein